MVTTEDIVDEFRGFGLEFQSVDAADHAVTLCSKYQLSAEELLNKCNGYILSQKAKHPTLTTDVLDTIAVKCLEKAAADPVILYATPTPKPTHNLVGDFRSPFSSFSTGKRGLQNSSVSRKSDKKAWGGEDSLLDGTLSFDDAPSLSISEPVVPFAERISAGKVVAAYGALPSGAKWNMLPRASGTVEVAPQDRSVYLDQPYPYMFVRYQDVALSLSNVIDDIAMKVASSEDIAEYTSPASIGSVDAVHTVGRLLPNEDGGLWEHHLVLQTSSTLHRGIISQIDVNLVKDYKLFPGQVVALEGHGNGQFFAASKIIHGSIPHAAARLKRSSKTLHVMVACGPYHIEDHSEPEPLKELISSFESVVPDVLILMGPFVDEKVVATNSFSAENVTIDSYFRSLMKLLFDEVVTKRDIHLVLIPSVGQLVEFPVYPVPGFSLQSCIFDEAYADPEFLKKVTFAPEPSLLNIGGVVFGLTSTDILMHLKKRELTRGSSEGFQSRLVGHLLLQQSFYPLYPPETPADIAALHDYARIPEKPDILITPSSFSGFTKNVHGTVCVNPEKMSKGRAGGSFARIFVQAADSEAATKDLSECIAVEVVKI